MKSKIVFPTIYLFLLCLVADNKTVAQQKYNPEATNHVKMQMFNGQASGNYSFHVFIAPNKSYGYDILNNARVIYHQPAFPRVPGDLDIVITRKEEANIAAMLAIERMKKGLSPELPNEELKKITAKK